VLRRRHGQPYRIIGILESIMVQLAQARAHFKVPGTPPEVAELFRDKAKMKAALRAAGLPVARSRLIRGREPDARGFADEVGFPMVLKPPAGMGGKSTFRVGSYDELLRAAKGMGASDANPVLAEEFLRGREFSFETISTEGRRAESPSRTTSRAAWKPSRTRGSSGGPACSRGTSPGRSTTARGPCREPPSRPSASTME
jgi:biotin carboxylase